MIRNSLTNVTADNGKIVLSADPTELLRTLALPGVKDLMKSKVKMLIAVESKYDLGTLIAEWPTPVVICPREIGDVLRFPAASIDKDFAWATPGHPVADFYRASGTMPFDAQGGDLAAMLYAVKSENGMFEVKDKRLTVVAGQAPKIVEAFVEMASAKPVPRQPFRRPPAAPPPAPPQVKKSQQ